MSVFDDLVDELKNENLLEDTVVDLNRAPSAPTAAEVERCAVDLGEVPADVDQPSTSSAASADLGLPLADEPANEREFFRKRAMDEVSSLQMVEHVLSGVERAHMKTVPAAFDVLKIKQALHKFLQLSEDSSSPEHAEAELALRQETEAWNFALYERDQKISVANIRRFCEESRPVLSSQALIALARFYRNSPYTEAVRGKFDYVVTRLFSRDVGGEKREQLFEARDMIGHVNSLYAEWSSVVLYTSEEDKVEVGLTVTRFDNFLAEVEKAESFDELLESDFFERVRIYKEESAELFFVPEVISAALRCNLAIGNRYIELIGQERKRHSAESIQEKYSSEHDQIVSDVAGKTFSAGIIFRMETEEDPKPRRKDAVPGPRKSTPAHVRAKSVSAPAFDLFGVNKWLIIACIVFIALSAGVYVWAEKFAGGSESGSEVATPVQVEDPELGRFIKSLRSSRDMLYAVVTPEFEQLKPKERIEILAKVRAFAETKNLPKVNLLNSNGRSEAFASKDRLELVEE
jgi:hypothetical protein